MSKPFSNPTQAINSQRGHVVYLALGSNLGDRAANLRRAIDSLAPVANVLAASPVYETPPWGFEDQPAFLNQVIQAETAYEPIQLLEYLKQLETHIGRQPTFPNGPRVIDLDILMYDQLIYRSPKLTLPHPRMCERAFVLVPLVDLAPDLLHPTHKASMRQLLEKIDAAEIKIYSS